MRNWNANLPEPDRSRIFLERSELWPHKGLLPLKRPKESETLGIEEGFIFASSPTLVYLGNIFFHASNALRHEKLSYESLDALIADGWRVD